MRLDQPEPHFYTTSETARILGVSRRQVATYCQNRVLAAIRLGENGTRGRWRILRAGVDALAREPSVTSPNGVRVQPARPTQGGEAA